MQGFYFGAQMNGSDKRRWFRVAPRGLVSRVGKILLGPKTMPIDCYVVDLSAGGACLELQRTYTQEVRISSQQHKTLLHARVGARFSHWHKLRGHTAKIVSIRGLEQTKERQ